MIGCVDNFPLSIALPRGCLDAARELQREDGIRCELHDECFAGDALDARFVGALRSDQEHAVAVMLRDGIGVLCVSTAFRQDVTVATLIARRGVNTRVLVHRAELLKQWRQHLQAFLDVGQGVIGSVSGGKAEPTERIDIAVMQSLPRRGETPTLVAMSSSMNASHLDSVVRSHPETREARYVLRRPWRWYPATCAFPRH